MTALRRRADPLVAILLITLATVAAACGPSASSSARSSLGEPTPSAALTAVPDGPASPVVGATIGPPTTTDTGFGTIYDTLPSSFPRLPGQEPAETGAGPTSGSFAVNMAADAAVRAMEAALTAQGWSVDVGSPLEDGTVVLDATGATAGCRTEVRFTPVSGTVIMSVLYGASCPFG